MNSESFVHNWMLKKDTFYQVYKAVSALNCLKVKLGEDEGKMESYFWELSLKENEENLDNEILYFVSGFINNCGLPLVIEYFNSFPDKVAKEFIVDSYIEGLENYSVQNKT